MQNKRDIWFVYDGQCPLCQAAASMLKIREMFGKLHIIDARISQNHPILKEINQKKLDLDQGMVIKYLDRLYHGSDSLHLMAILSSNQGYFNKINRFLFRSKILSRICYPFMKFARNIAISLKGVGKINNLAK